MCNPGFSEKNSLSAQIVSIFFIGSFSNQFSPNPTIPNPTSSLHHNFSVPLSHMTQHNNGFLSHLHKLTYLNTTKLQFTSNT